MLPCVDVSDNIQLETIQCLSNPAHLPRLSRLMSNDDERMETERNFYRRRILQLTRDLSKNNIQAESLHQAYNVYANACVSYLQGMDKRDIIQSGHDLGSGPTSNNTVATKPYESKDDLELLGKAMPVNGMKNFVIRHRGRGKHNEEFPEVKTVDLKASGLRTKGLKPKTKQGGKRVRFTEPEGQTKNLP